MRYRSQMSKAERHARSQLMFLLRQGPILRGSLSVLRNTCGKSNCKCAKGQKHESVYVNQSRNGKRHARCVPKAKRAHVRQWIERYKEIQNLLEEISKTYWQELDEPNPK